MPSEVVERDGLIFVRITGVVDVESATILGQQVHTYLDARGGGVRMFVDTTQLSIYSPQGAETLLALMKKANPKLHRAAFIAPASQTAALQLSRLIREAGGENRRIFGDAAEAMRWLRE